tara:strand:+ start:1291 stop:1809 length:519 start_codon:yes stop_codon:yes gene_type:complete
MALGLFQIIGIGLAIALILIPIVRWFWKRFDMPSKFALEALRRKEIEAEEAEMWAGIEAQVEAEEVARREFEMKQKEKQERAGKSLDETQSAEVWNKLGIDVPIQPVEREIAPQIVEKKETEAIELTLDNALKPSKSPDEPDWELVQKMSKLDKPVEGVPEALDLDSLLEEE